MKQRLKRIRAGRLVREVLWTPAFPSDNPKTRAEKTRCSTEARRKINDRTSWQKLKTVLATNFSGSDIVMTATYDDRHIPYNRDDARMRLSRFLRALRKQRREHGQELRYVYCTEDKHGDGRLHHHIVLNGTGEDFAVLRSLWTYGQNLHFELLDIYGYEELARYLTKEAREFGHAWVGARSWVGSRNLKKPEIMPSEWVSGSVRLQPPQNAHVLSTESFENSWGRFAYVEYLLPPEPKAVRTRPRAGAGKTSGNAGTVRPPT